MYNSGLLRLLAGVLDHVNTGKTLMTCTGFDPLELQIALATAEDAEFVETTGQIQPSLRVTAAGMAWAQGELAPYAALMPATTMRGAA